MIITNLNKFFKVAMLYFMSLLHKDYAIFMINKIDYKYYNLKNNLANSVKHITYNIIFFFLYILN